MQSIQSENRRGAVDGKATDFDFGTSAGVARKQGQKPMIAAGLIAVAFALSMFIPVGAKADPAWMVYPDQLSAPTKPAADAAVIRIDDRRHELNKDLRSLVGNKGKKRVPAACSLQIEQRGGDLRLYSENCMRNHGVRGDLPRRCAVNARIFGSRDRLYPHSCLTNAGFNVERR